MLCEEDKAKNAMDHDSHDIDVRGLALLMVIEITPIGIQSALEILRFFYPEL